MAQQGNRVGQHLGNYQLEHLLGQGGFAEVYLGHHLRLQRQAAIKVLHAHLSAQEVGAFQREAQIIANLDHPNIVRILDFDVQQGVPFLVMDYLPNGTLRQRHAKGERVPLPTVVAYVKQIADALQYAHDQRLIHRDVKPENMLIGRRNQIVLSDFGIAAIAHGTSSMTNQSIAGTIYYMAPEQIQSQARPASDQYALAVVVYEWLSGVRPFEGSYTEIFAKHLMTPPPSLRQHLPGLAPEVEQVVFTALAKEPGQRFGSVRAFATALEAASQRAPKEATGQTPLQPMVPMVEERAFTRLPLSGPPPSQSAPVLAPPTIHMPTNLTTPVSQERAPAIAPPPASIPPPERPGGRKISRRTVVIGLTAAGVVVAGGATWYIVSARPSLLPLPSSRPSPLPSSYVYRGHSDTVRSAAWSPDGTRIASGSYDNTVQVWNAVDGSHVFTYKGHTGVVYSVAWSPDGTRIALGSVDDTVQVWNAADGGNVFTYKGQTGGVASVAWSPDGTRIASGSYDNTVQVWNAADGSHVFTYQGHASYVISVAWSPDGTRIASGSGDYTVQVWNAVDGSHVFTYKGHTGVVYSVAWSPDGTRIASGGDDHTVQVWNAADGSHVFTYKGHTGVVLSVAWSPDGTRIASGSGDNTVQVWNAADGSHVFTYQGHSSYVDSVAWSPDGTRIASGSNDKTVQMWTPQ